MNDSNNTQDTSSPIITFSEIPESVAVEKVGEVLGVDKAEVDKYSQKLKEIIDWAKVKSNKLEDILDNIKSLEARIGNPQLGERIVNHIYRYVYLLTEKDKINKQIEGLEKDVSSITR